MKISKSWAQSLADRWVYECRQLSSNYDDIVNALIQDPDNDHPNKTEDDCYGLYIDAISTVIQENPDEFVTADGDLNYTTEFQQQVDSMFKELIEQRYN